MTTLMTRLTFAKSALCVGLCATFWAPSVAAQAGPPAGAPPASAPGVEAAPVVPGAVTPGPVATGAPVMAPPADPTMPTGDPQDHKLRELEEKVISLKEKVFRAKTRLLLLQERLLNDVIAEAKVVVFHDNDMGGSLKPVQVLYHLDGEKVYFQDDSSKILEDQASIEIFNQNLRPGNHVLAVEMVYRGDSSLFAYLDDYLFKLRANYTFYATKGKITTVRATGYLRGDITYDLRERPSIKFDVKQVSYTKDGTPVSTDVEGGEGAR
ncbi:MAG: hypothetical protein ACI9MR_004136 [Myxococcota bacterium]|jgi:hypothetical protein